MVGQLPRAGVVAMLAVFTGMRGGAQSPPPLGLLRADSLLAAGVVERAESLYYAAANARPRDPIARAALGRYLAARGAFAVGATLLEEARQFGGDAVLLARDLSWIYQRTDNYTSLARLPGSPLVSAERARAAWLVSAGSAVRIADSAAVRFRSEVSSRGLGRLECDIAGVHVVAVLDTRGAGIVVDPGSPLAAQLRRFGGRVDSVFAIADSVSFGELTITNVPVLIAATPGGSPVTVGLEFFARFAPTLDAGRGMLTLRASGRATRIPDPSRYPMLSLPSGARVLVAGRWVPLAEQLRTVLPARPITLDLRRGQLLIDR
jgi:hypothetical protein